MSSYKQLSNQGTLLLCAGASESADKRRPVSQQCNQHRTKSPLSATAHSCSPQPEGRAGAGGAGAGGARAGGAFGLQSSSARGLVFNTQPHAS